MRLGEAGRWSMLTMVNDHGHNLKMATTVPASVFKAKCLAMLDDVAASGETIIVTKHGRPVAQLVPIEQPVSTMGSVQLISGDDADYFSTGEQWNADA